MPQSTPIFLPAASAQARMNTLGAQGTPFVFVIDYLCTKALVQTMDEVDAEQLLFDFDGFTNRPQTLAPELPEQVRWESFPESFESYAAAFEVVKNHILAGNSFLTNLTRCTPISTDISLRSLFLSSRAKYRLWLKDSFALFSPEIFVRIDEQGLISSFPMKGTMDAGLPHAERLLLDDAKEAAEHATIVDLIRNDLSMVARGVCVKRYRYIDRLTTNRGELLQTSSEIQGQLPDGFCNRLGDILFRLLPAGSITGAPKAKTMEIIAQAEGYERGFYTGVMGYYDGHRLDSAVMIRFVEQDADGRLFYKSGGGITCNSDPRSEYEEMKQKIYAPIY